MRFYACRLLGLCFVGLVGLAALAACSSSSGSTSSGGSSGSSGSSGNGSGTCTGDTAACIQGTLITRGFNIALTSAKVQLYAVFPYGKATPAAEATVTSDGKWAMSGVDPAGRYYLQGIGKFEGTAGTVAVAAVVGPVTLPLSAPVDLKLQPVFLEALEQRPSGGALALSWASAHVYDPGTGAELLDAKVMLTTDAQALDMPFGTNLSGQKSYFLELPKGTPPPAALGVRVAHASFPGGATYALSQAAPEFDAVVTAPADQAALTAGQPFDVVWNADPRAAYAIVEVFAPAAGGTFAATYASDAPRAPTVTKETIPASAFTTPGSYLLNVQLARPNCPATSDGCVYGASTAAVNVTVK